MHYSTFRLYLRSAQDSIILYICFIHQFPVLFLFPPPPVPNEKTTTIEIRNTIITTDTLLFLNSLAFQSSLDLPGKHTRYSLRETNTPDSATLALYVSRNWNDAKHNLGFVFNWRCFILVNVWGLGLVVDSFGLGGNGCGSCPKQA